MAPSTPMLSERRTPEDRDVVVREEKRDTVLVYVLHIAPGADRCLLRTREEAIKHAVSLAKREGVRAWLTDEEYDFFLLEDFRAVETL